MKIVRYKNHKQDICNCCICKVKRGEFKVSEKIKLQISLKMKGRLKSSETRYRMSLAQKGHKVIYSLRLKISKSLMGRKRPEFEKEKIRNTVRDKIESGQWLIPIQKLESHWNWQGGKSKEFYGLDFTSKLKDEIRQRDNYTCQNCGMTEEEHIIVWGENLTVHHIDYEKKNNDKTNLISTCRPCNIRANYNREYWKQYFQNKIKEKVVI